MKVVIREWHTKIFPTDEEVKELCKPGHGEDTCIWLLVAPTGWECCCLNKPTSLLDRWERGGTTAKRNGCDKVAHD